MHRYRRLAVVVTALSLLVLPGDLASAQVPELSGTFMGQMEPATPGGIPPARVTGSGVIRGVSVEFFVEKAGVRAQGRADITTGHELDFAFDQDLFDGRAEIWATEDERGLRGEIVAFDDGVGPSFGCFEVRVEEAEFERTGLVIVITLVLDVRVTIPCDSDVVLADTFEVEGALVLIPDTESASDEALVVGPIRSVD